jgi:4-hydroxy-2-oxoheptanedioate aldolase
MSAGAQQPVSPENALAPEMPKQTTRTGKRVNRIIDMWLKNQPVYYSQISGGGYEEARKMAATKADYITYEMEHGPLDFKELREFMRGLVDAGPARTGHKTPAVSSTN